MPCLYFDYTMVAVKASAHPLQTSKQIFLPHHNNNYTSSQDDCAAKACRHHYVMVSQHIAVMFVCLHV